MKLNYAVSPATLYRSVPLIRPLRKYAPPLFSAKVPAQGSLTRYNAPPVSIFWNIKTTRAYYTLQVRSVRL